MASLMFYYCSLPQRENRYRIPSEQGDSMNGSIRAGVLGVMAIAFLGGCARHKMEEPTPMTPAPISADDRAQIQKTFGNAAIGTVVAVRPEDHLAAVSDLHVQDFRQGDVFTFFGGEQVPLATGEVVAIVKDQLHIRYVPAAGERPLAKGDLAVRFKQ